MRTIAIGLAVAALAGGTVAADSDADEPVATHIRGKLAGTVARLTFQYRFAVERGTQNLRSLGIPPQAIVIGATVVSPSRHALGLIAAGDGVERFEAIREKLAGKAARWSVLISSEGGGSSVDVSMTAPVDGHVTLELVTEQATCFHRDVRYVAVPVAWATALSPELRAIKSDHDAITAVCGDPGEQIWIGFASRELLKRGIERVGSVASRGAFGDIHVAKLELGVASRLGDVPADLATAIVIDASRSLTAGERATQRELVAAYLRATPDSRVQVIAYDRTARGLLPGWTPARRAAAQIDRELLALPGANGSNVDAGLVEAARWLARTKGTRRIVVVTDERLSSRFGDEPSRPLAKLVPRGVLLHAVTASESDSEPSRNDYGVLAQLALGTTGFAIDTGRPAAGIDATLLARPLTLDHLAIEAHDWKHLNVFDDRDCGEGLAQGAGCTWWGQGDATSTDITVRGSVWGRQIVRVLRPDSSRTVELARELGSRAGVSEAILEAAAPHAHAVNRAWSLFAEWGGQHGYGEDIIRSACGCLALGTIGTSSRSAGYGHSIGIGPKLPPLALEPQLAPAVQRCNLGSHRVTAEIENTGDEIVDVSVTVAPDPSSTPLERQSLRDCVAERIWDTQITVPPTHSHVVTRVVFGD
jgi:hypothetical protein